MAGTIIQLDPHALMVSKSNVRTTTNPAFAAIKSSIKVDKAKALVFTVSRPTNDHQWVVVHGGATRLLAVQELHLECRESESPYETVNCLAIPWEDSLHAQIAGIRENRARGDTSFAEDCAALQSIRAEWVSSQGTEDIDKEFLRYLKTNGINLSASHYARMRICAALYLVHLPIWTFKGRAPATHITDLIQQRAEMTRVLAHPPAWLDIGLSLSTTEAKIFYDRHFNELAAIHDARDLCRNKLLNACCKRVAKALSITPKELKLAMSGRELKVEDQSAITLFKDNIELSGNDPGWSFVAQSFGVENNFKGALHALVSLPTDQLTALVKTLRTSLSPAESSPR